MYALSFLSVTCHMAIPGDFVFVAVSLFQSFFVCTFCQKWQEKIASHAAAVGEDGGGQKIDPENLANMIWLRGNTKPCPKCNTNIQKDEGKALGLC